VYFGQLASEVQYTFPNPSNCAMTSFWNVNPDLYNCSKAFDGNTATFSHTDGDPAKVKSFQV